MTTFLLVLRPDGVLTLRCCGYSNNPAVALVKSETHGRKYVDWSTGIYLVSIDARIK